MESFLKSEIARLVYGYLVDECCSTAAQVFLETSAHLEECLSVVKKGRRFGTKKCGKTLVEILEILADVTCLVQNYQQNQESDDLIDKLTPFLILDETPTPQSSFKRSSVKNLNDSIPETPKSSLPEKPSKKSQENSDNEYDERPGLQALLENTEWHERLAENINKVVVSNETSSNDKPPLEKILEKKTVENIVTNLEADPMFEEILNELVGPRVDEENNENVEVSVRKDDFMQPKTIEIPPIEIKTPEPIQSPSPQARPNTSSSYVPAYPQIFLQSTSNMTGMTDPTVLTASSPIVAKHLTTIPSPIPCNLLSHVTQMQGIPKVFFRKDPNIATPKIHMKVDEKKILDILPKQIEPKSEHVIIKRSGVRTRGGKRPIGKVQTRLKVTPAKKPETTKIEVVVLNEKPAEVSEKPENLPEAQPVVENVVSVDERKEDVENKQNVEEAERKEMTPIQSKITAYKKRMSLSSPRRNHVRTLEFKTPPKGANQRKALTSPKNLKGPSRLLKNVKRGCLFKSPSPPPPEPKEKSKKAWDADLRIFTENIDIPTSVGLQRKTPTKAEEKSDEKIEEKNDEKIEEKRRTPPPCEFLKNMSPISSSSKSPGNLERTLIKECQRIEKFEKQKLSDEEISLKILEETSNPVPLEAKKDDVFQTPAKPIIPIVDMTPLSKIRMEISELGKTKLVTPTLPQTPLPPQVESTPPEPDSPPVTKVTKKPAKTRKPRKTASPKSRKTRASTKANKTLESFDVDKTIAECLEMAKIQLYKNPRKSSEESPKESPKNESIKEKQKIENKILESKKVENTKVPVEKVKDSSPKVSLEVKIQGNQKVTKFSQHLENYSFGVFCEEENKTMLIKASPYINLFDLFPEKEKVAVKKDEKMSRDRSSDSTKREKEKKSRERSSDSERKRRNRSYSSDEENDTKRPRFYSKRLSDYPERRYNFRREWKPEPRRRESYYSHKRPRYDEVRRGKTRQEERLSYRRRKGIYTPTKIDIKSPEGASRRRSYETKSEKHKTSERRISSVETIKEEGELSDTSCSFSPKRSKHNVFSRQKSGHRHSPSVTADNRASLLKELDVESFLSLVHGKEANKPL